MPHLRIAHVTAVYRGGTPDRPPQPELWRLLIRFDNGQEISLTEDEFTDAISNFLDDRAPLDFSSRLTHCEHCGAILQGGATTHRADCPTGQMIAAFPAHTAADIGKQDQFAAAEKRYDQRQAPPQPSSPHEVRPALGETDHWPDHPTAQQLREEIQPDSPKRKPTARPRKKRRPAAKQSGAPHHEEPL